MPEKACPTCGRRFAWRKRWARQWEQIVFCSDRCRGRRTREQDVDLERRIMALLGQRARGATVCPSEVLAVSEKQDPIRMEAVRAAARRLAHRGLLDVLQRRAIVDPASRPRVGAVAGALENGRLIQLRALREFRAR